MYQRCLNYQHWYCLSEEASLPDRKTSQSPTLIWLEKLAPAKKCYGRPLCSQGYFYAGSYSASYLSVHHHWRAWSSCSLPKQTREQQSVRHLPRSWPLQHCDLSSSTLTEIGSHSWLASRICCFARSVNITHEYSHMFDLGLYPAAFLKISSKCNEAINSLHIFELWTLAVAHQGKVSGQWTG